VASSHWRHRTIRICGGDLTSGPRDDCPGSLHDFPLPSGYGDASEAAERRLRHRWRNVRCPACGLYGWQPGDPTGDPCDQRVPAGQTTTTPPAR
jgi:hypothetical protein